MTLHADNQSISILFRNLANFLFGSTESSEGVIKDEESDGEESSEKVPDDKWGKKLWGDQYKGKDTRKPVWQDKDDEDVL